LKKTVLLVSILSVFLTGCVEIVEEIFINKDRSGTIIYRVETNGAGILLNNISGFLDQSIEDQLEAEAFKFIKQLEDQPGISNLEYKLSIRSEEYYVKCDFENYKVFNEALYKVSGNKKSWFSPPYFRIKRNQFKKINFSPWIKRYAEKENIELPSPVFANMISFSSTIHTPEQIIKIKPSTVELKEDKTTTKQNFLFVDILENNVNTGIRIRY
jgi:hypothetical protein